MRSYLVNVLLLAAAFTLSGVEAAPYGVEGRRRALKSKKTRSSSSSKGAKSNNKLKKGEQPSEPTALTAPIDAVYIMYQRMANSYLTEIDNIANEVIEDLDEFYESRIAAFQTDDVVWDIDAGARKFQLEGNEAVRGLFSSFATRKFAFHQWSHHEVNEIPGKTEVALRYHGVILESEGNYLDIFGVIKVHYNGDEMIDFVFVQRFNTIDRVYAALI
jgi:hypothetical protein